MAIWRLEQIGVRSLRIKLAVSNAACEDKILSLCHDLGPRPLDSSNSSWHSNLLFRLFLDKDPTLAAAPNVLQDARLTGLFSEHSLCS